MVPTFVVTAGSMATLDEEEWEGAGTDARQAACQAAVGRIGALLDHARSASTDASEQAASMLPDALRAALARLAGGRGADSGVQDALLDVVSAAAGAVARFLAPEAAPAVGAAAAEAARLLLAPGSADVGASLAGAPAHQQSWLSSAITVAVAALRSAAAAPPPRERLLGGAAALAWALEAVSSPPRGVFADVGGAPAAPDDPAGRAAAAAWRAMAAEVLGRLPPLLAALADAGGLAGLTRSGADPGAGPGGDQHAAAAPDGGDRGGADVSGPPRRVAWAEHAGGAGSGVGMRPGVLIEELPADGDPAAEGAEVPEPVDPVPALLAAALFIDGGAPPLDAPWADAAGGCAALALVAALDRLIRPAPRRSPGARRAEPGAGACVAPARPAAATAAPRAAEDAAGARGRDAAGARAKDATGARAEDVTGARAAEDAMGARAEDAAGRLGSGSAAPGPAAPAAGRRAVAALLPAAARRLHRALDPPREARGDGARVAPLRGAPPRAFKGAPHVVSGRADAGIPPPGCNSTPARRPGAQRSRWAGTGRQGPPTSRARPARRAGRVRARARGAAAGRAGALAGAGGAGRRAALGAAGAAGRRGGRVAGGAAAGAVGAAPPGHTCAPRPAPAPPQCRARSLRTPRRSTCAGCRGYLKSTDHLSRFSKRTSDGGRAADAREIAAGLGIELAVSALHSTARSPLATYLHTKKTLNMYPALLAAGAAPEDLRWQRALLADAARRALAGCDAAAWPAAAPAACALAVALDGAPRSAHSGRGML